MSSNNRIHAINTIASRPVPGPAPAKNVDISFYGEDVFNGDAIRQYLPKDTAEKLLLTITEGAPLDPAIAGDVAHAMKEWAMARGVTHFTHWFQPLTGGTAEKHDAFLEGTGMAQAIMTFSGTPPVRRSSSATLREPLCVSPRRSALTRVRHLTARRPFCAPFKLSGAP